jgi:hypothetical protein
MSVNMEKHSFVDDRRVRIALTATAVALILFNPLWITLRFSALFGSLLTMQAAYDEPYYFWQLYQQVMDGALDVNYRLFSKLLAAVLVPLGASFDVALTIYGLLNPLLAFAAALVLVATWERRSLARVIWALLLLFSFDFLSGSSRVIDYEPPATWLANLVGNPAVLRPDGLSFFLIHRRPEPQSSWIVLFLHWALLVSSFLRWRRETYLIVCAATPFLAFIYINAAVTTILIFGLLSLCNLVFYRRPVIVPFVLSIAATALAYGMSYAFSSTGAIAAQSVFATHLPLLRPSVGFSLAGMIWAGVMLHRHGTTPARLAALIFFAAPTIVLNQQMITGIAVMPQNWELYVSYPCIVVGAGLMSGQYLSSFERRHDWRQFLSIGLLVVIGYFLVQGAWRNELYWSPYNVRSVLAVQVLSQAKTKVDRIDAVILPHLYDESLFLPRVPRGTVVMGGYNTMIEQPAPRWLDDESFEDHAKKASASFAAGFETLFRSGITPAQLQANMEAELKTGDCWTGLSYFFSLSDCWPSFLNYTSHATPRLPGTVPAIVDRYRRYLAEEAARDLSKRQVLLIRNEPLPTEAGGLIDNQLVGTAEIDMRGTPVRAYGYIQRPKGP